MSVSVIEIVAGDRRGDWRVSFEGKPVDGVLDVDVRTVEGRSGTEKRVEAVLVLRRFALTLPGGVVGLSRAGGEA